VTIWPRNADVPDGLRRTLRIGRPSLASPLRRLEIHGFARRGRQRRSARRARVAQCDGGVVGLTDVNIGGQLDVVREFSPYIPTGAPNVQVRARPTPEAIGKPKRAVLQRLGRIRWSIHAIQAWGSAPG
jgi:hypothetical protein